MSVEERQRAIHLLKLSPSALRSCLNPIPPIAIGRTERVVDEQQNKRDVETLFRILHECLRHDYSEPWLKDFYYEIKNVVELDTSFTVKVKSKERVLLEDTVRARQGIVLVPSEKPNGKEIVVLTVLWNDKPEPWEKSRPAPNEEGKIP